MNDKQKRNINSGLNTCRADSASYLCSTAVMATATAAATTTAFTICLLVVVVECETLDVDFGMRSIGIIATDIHNAFQHIRIVIREHQRRLSKLNANAPCQTLTTEFILLMYTSFTQLTSRTHTLTHTHTRISNGELTL